MKKIIFASAATLLISMFAGCSAADDSQISAPRSNVTKIPKSTPATPTGIQEMCESYSAVETSEESTIYFCRDDEEYYGCDKKGTCQKIEGYEEYEE